jgi:Phytanoyl-CoA dioxygenase (PhyH)
MLDMDKRKLARDMLDQVRLPDEELDSRYENAIDPVYWRKVSPLTPLESASADLLIDLPSDNAESIDETVTHLRRRGYFETGQLLPASAVAPMLECVEAVIRAGWPPVFALLYDNFWAVTRIPFLVKLLSTVLGAEYNVIMSRGWCYYVPPTLGAGGWTPHADDYAAYSQRLTVWIALTEATLDNGCIYVVPKDLLYKNGPPNEYPLAPVTLPRDYYLQLLQCCRALPTLAGSILGWDMQTIHWGSKCHRPREPRISLGYEFASKDFLPSPHGKDELFPGEPSRLLPTFAQRLRSVGRSLRLYRGRDLRARKFAELGRRLVENKSTLI